MQWSRVLLALSIVSPITLTAQQAGTVTIDVAVNDAAGKPVRGLQRQNFTLLDDKQAKGLTSFRAVDMDAGTQAPPVEMVLVIDAINADVIKAEHEREGIRSFLESNGGKLALPVTVVTLTDQGMLKPMPPSQDGNALAATLDQNRTGLRTVNRSSAFGAYERYDLSLKALDSLIAYESGKPGRKLIVWVSPGWPLLSLSARDISSKDQQQIFHTIVSASTELRLGHITLYNVVARGIASTDVSQFSYYTSFLKGVKSPGQAFPPNLALAVLAVQSGGLVLDGNNDLADAMGKEIAKSAGDARSFYVLTFQPPHADHANEYHTLLIKVDQPGVTARTRTGYYAQP
jgi:VWFA-related protein